MEKDKKSAVIGVILSICILVMWNLMLAEPVHASEGSLLIEAQFLLPTSHCFAVQDKLHC